MSILWAAFLGLVQGVAEFLPISSSGHLSVLQNIFELQTAEGGHMLFDVLLHFATLISVCLVYRRDVTAMVTDVIGLFRGGGLTDKNGQPKLSLRMVFMIIVATLPLFLILPFNDRVEQLYYKTGFIGVTFLLTGCLLYVSDRMTPGVKKGRSMTILDALVIGLCQAVATIPGLSRSGTTITAGMATGLEREYAVKFSFLVSLPAILGANILSLVDVLKEGGIEWSLLPAYLVGMLVAGVSGYFAIGLIRLLAAKGKFGKFAYYCWFAGILTIILSIIF